MVKKVEIMQESWDYLIVLDACRYDYFLRVYSSYLSGQLEKVISPASSTCEWCRKCFKEKYSDVVYISANPFINSKAEIGGFDAKRHFCRIVDVWDWGWNVELGTVHPRQVNKAVRIFSGQYPHKRFIVHYMQPHSPYLSLRLHGFPEPQVDDSYILEGIRKDRKDIRKNSYVIYLEKLAAFFTILAERTGMFGKNPSWKIRELMRLPPTSPMDAVRRKLGQSALRKAYTENLKLVLEYVRTIVQELSGLIVITADHGELLGEGGAYSHTPGSSDPYLLSVPWFQVQKTTRRRRIHNRV